MNPVWSKAPLLLLKRYRKVFVAVLGAAMLLGLASTAGPLFVSASGSAALADQLEGQPPLVNSFQIGRFDTFASTESREGFVTRTELLNSAIGAREHIGDPITALVGPNRPVTAEGAEGAPPVRIISRSQADEHVEISSGDASGALLADTAAEELGGIGPGDEIFVGAASEPLEITGIYQALATAPFDPYWVNFGGLIFPGPNADAIPPPLLILPEDPFFDLASELGLNGNYFWEYPLEGEMTLTEAEDLATYMQIIDRGVNDNEEIGEELEQEIAAEFATNSLVTATFPAIVNDAKDTIAALEGPVLVLSLAGRLVALAVIAAAGAYLIVSRKTEAQLMSARGMTNLQQGMRASIETLLPALLGVAIGAVIGYFLVIAVGPSDLIAKEDVTSAIFQSGYTLIAGSIALAGAAALTVRTLTAPNEKKRNAFTRVPWEVPILVLAGAAFYEITTRDSVIIEGADGDRIDVFVLVFPVLFLLGTAGLVARGLKGVFGKVRSLGSNRSSAVYLASRRLAAAPASIVGLLIASVLAVGILVYAQSLAETIQASTEAKAGVFVGSDVQLLVYSTAEVPPDFPLPATKVRKLPDLAMTNGARFTMMGVDRSSFQDAAFWDDSFADSSLDQLMDSIEPQPGEPLPVIVVGSGIESTPTMDLSTDIELRRVATVRAFPGMVAGEALVVADVEGLNELFSGANSTATAGSEDQIWARGTLNEALQATQDANISVGTTRSTDQVLDRPTLASVTWAFDLLRALGISAGAIVLLAVLLYMQARQRSTVISYAMARRMGLRKNQHATALAIEIAAILAIAVIAGTLLAIAVSQLVYGYLDLLPQIPPTPVLRVPNLVVLVILAGGIAAAIIGAIFVQRGADRAKVAEVLRLAE